MNALLLALLQAVPWYLFPGTAVESVPSEEAEISVILPISPDSPSDKGMIDFCNGVLLASRDLGLAGRKMNIRFLPDAPETEAGRRLAIGPINWNEIAACCAADRSRFFISPLDQKAETLVDSLKIVQVPTGSDIQLLDNIDWLIMEYVPGEDVFVVSDGAFPEGKFSIIPRRLSSCSIPHRIISPKDISHIYPEKELAKPARFIIASDNAGFVGGAIREIGLCARKGLTVAGYCASRFRPAQVSETESLHHAGLRVSASYHIDYTDADVHSFVLKYRALFNVEPNSFAFHGYDCLKYFADLVCEYGEDWPDHITDFRSDGLQTGFEFKKKGLGFVNVAARRFVYNPDFSIAVQQ